MCACLYLCMHLPVCMYTCMFMYVWKIPEKVMDWWFYKFPPEESNRSLSYEYQSVWCFLLISNLNISNLCKSCILQVSQLRSFLFRPMEWLLLIGIKKCLQRKDVSTTKKRPVTLDQITLNLFGHKPRVPYSIYSLKAWIKMRKKNQNKTENKSLQQQSAFLRFQSQLAIYFFSRSEFSSPAGLLWQR